MELARVSVVIPVFNGELTVVRAIDSVFAQDFEGTEIVVVNDGSTDATPQVLDRYRDRVRVIRQDNRGSPAARNVGVEASRTQYVAFLDADDVWLPRRLQKTFAALECQPDAVAAYSDAIPVNDLDVPVAASYLPVYRTRGPSMQELLNGGWPILPSTALIRREAYLSVGGFCEQYKGAKGFADVWFFMLLRERGPFVYVPEPLIRYRIPPLIERREKYAPGFETFSRLMLQRYGAAAEHGLRFRGHWSSVELTNEAVRALACGDTKLARRALLCARRYERLDRRNLLRLVRAYLPARIAMALTSRKRRVAGYEGAKSY